MHGITAIYIIVVSDNTMHIQEKTYIGSIKSAWSEAIERACNNLRLYIFAIGDFFDRLTMHLFPMLIITSTTTIDQCTALYIQQSPT